MNYTHSYPSNFAMAWHALRLAGVEDCEPRLGRLFAL